MFCQKCSAEVGESQKFCGNCGASLPSSTVESQPKRERSRFARVMFWGLGIILAFCVLSLVLKVAEHDTEQDSPGPLQLHGAGSPAAEEQQNSPSPPAVEEQTLPEDESELISTVNSFKARYSGAANEFQKSTLRRERANAIAAILPSRSVKNWIGQVSLMQTTGDGRGVLYVRLPASTHIQVGTMNNSFSDIGEHTLIPQGSTLYDQVAKLAVGNEVVFSGTFASRDMDYVGETSVTEEGSMTEPDFIFTFTNVSTKIPSPPQTAVPGDRNSPNNVASSRKAAEPGDAKAQYKLGRSYYNGQGVPQDYAQAANWFRKGAERGYAPAQNGLGASYYLGRGVPQDDAQAAAWWRKAAEQGYADTQYKLGALYVNGRGVPQDYVEAYFWLGVAALGKTEAIKQEDVDELRDDAASHLTPAELSQVRERVRKWFEDHPPKVE